MTLKEALAEGERLLKAPSPHASIDSPALDAALLLAEALKISREKLIVLGNEPMDDSDYESFLNLISKRLGGECIAYILGRKDFRYLSFTVNPEVLVPRPDTETLVEAALEYIDIFTEKSDKISLLDLCTGSGAVAISLKYERPNIKVTASDICIKALKTAAENAVCHNSTITFIESNLFENINGKFNIIVCNPPYIPSSELPALPAEVRREPKLALLEAKMAFSSSDK